MPSMALAVVSTDTARTVFKEEVFKLISCLLKNVFLGLHGSADQSKQDSLGNSVYLL